MEPQHRNGGHGLEGGAGLESGLEIGDICGVTALELPVSCLACGACCRSEGRAYVRVTGDDWTRLGAEAERWAHFLGHRAYLRMRGGACAALEIRRNEGGGAVHFCTIYDRRPEVCRALERGSPQCEAERMRKLSGLA